MSHGDKAHEALTEQELRDLDAADGVIDGKFHGAELKNMTHDATKSTREGEWEFRDGKYWRRDYYGATIPKKETPPPPPPPVHVCDHSECQRQISELRRQLNAKETLIAELHRLLADRDTEIHQLKSRISSLLVQIERYELRITTLETELRTLRTAPIPAPAPIIVQEPNSYYVVRSGRGAELLKNYGKTDIMIGQPQGYYDYSQYSVASGFTPVVPTMAGPIIVPQQSYVQSTVIAAPQRTTVEVRETQHVRSGENQYYNVDSEAMRARLDAMDGVIDGQLNGVDIRIGAGHGHSTTTTTRHVSGHTEGREFYRVDDAATLAKLDAMDGVIDGKFDGREIQVKGGAHGHIHGHSHSQSHVGHVSGREYYRADDSDAAARLDAMDGVIDGRLHGTDIVTRGRNDKIKRKK